MNTVRLIFRGGRPIKHMRQYSLILIIMLMAGLMSCTGEEAGQNQTADNPEIGRLLEKANQDFQSGEYQQSLDLLDSLAQVHPEHPDIFFLQGIVLNNLNRLDQAEDAYNTVLQLNPDYEGVRFNLGNIAMSRGQFENAVEYYRQEHARYPAPNTLVNMGLAFANLHQADSSVAAYEQAIALDSTFADAFVLLGQEYKNAGNPDSAIELTKQGLSLAPDNATYLSILSSFLLQNNQPKEALPYLEKAVAIRPWGYRPVYNLGLALERIGNETDSRKYLAKADTLRRLQSRVAHLQMQVQNNPEEFMRWVELGEVLRDMGNYRASRDALQTASLLQPQHLALQNNIAYLSMALGDTSAAIDIFESIVDHDPNQTDVWFNLGVVFSETGREVKAREAWQQVLNQSPQDTTAKRYLQQLSDS